LCCWITPIAALSRSSGTLRVARCNIAIAALVVGLLALAVSVSSTVASSVYANRAADPGEEMQHG